MNNQQQTPTIPWNFLVSYLVFFIGWIVSLGGSFVVSDGLSLEATSSRNPITGLLVTGVGMAISAIGSLLLASAELLSRHQFSGVFVVFVMTPIPAVLGVGINYLGNWLRKSVDATVPVMLVGAGGFCLFLAGFWLWERWQGHIGRDDWRAFGWALVGNVGLTASLLGIASLLLVRQRASADNEPDVDIGGPA